MSADNASAGGGGGGAYGTADRQAGLSVEANPHGQAASAPAEASSCLAPAPMPSASSSPGADLPRKRKGEGREGRADPYLQEPHRQIEKRRRDKMNNLIEELSAMIPACSPASRKLDKLTVLRRAVQHLKAIKVGASSPFAESPCKPSFLPQDDVRQLVLRAVDGFLLVVSCDRGKILFISESVSKILNFSRLELRGQSLFHFLHPKDISKVKEQLSASDFPRERLVDASTGVRVKADSPLGGSLGARRSFFCRMKHSRVVGNHEERSLLLSSKKKDSYRYCTIHCTGYMRSWPCSQLDEESDGREGSNLTCLVTVCRNHPPASPGSPASPADLAVKSTQFVMRCAIDGKFIFVDQQATTVTGYLPQEVLGTSCYEYFHQDDMQHLADKHRQVLRSKEKLETNCYKFKTKFGCYVCLQSQWFSFTNPWTKEVEFIVSRNRVISGPSHTQEDEGPGSSKALQEDSKRNLPIIPGLSSGAGRMIYAGSIGTQIASELVDSYRVSSSPSSGAGSPFAPAPDKSPFLSPPVSRSMSSRVEAPGRLDPQSELRSAVLAGSRTPGDTGDSAQLDLEGVVIPGLSSFSSDEAAMAVIMSLLDTDASLSPAGDFPDVHWPL